MKVWELIAKLSTCNAGAEVWGGNADRLNARLSEVEVQEAHDGDNPAGLYPLRGKRSA